MLNGDDLKWWQCWRCFTVCHSGCPRMWVLCCVVEDEASRCTWAKNVTDF